MNFDDIRKQLEEMRLKFVGKEYLTEIRIKTLLRKTKKDVKIRSRGYHVQYRIRLFKNGKDKFYFYVKKPGKKKYRVNFEFKGDNEDPLKDNVRVSCTCGYFKYFGPDFNARENGYSLRKMSDGSPPDIRDPHRENLICKHIYAAGKTLVQYLESLRND